MLVVRPLVLCLAFPLLARAALPEIADPARNPAWRDLFSALAAPVARQASFEERRQFPFRKKPVLLSGEMRAAPERGISLTYISPEPQILIGDAEGILFRDARGRDRPVPNDARTQAATAALLAVLRFDIDELQKSFSVRGEREADTWILQFIPRDPATADSLGAITVTGRGHVPERIEMSRAANQRIEILLHAPRENVTFSDADLKRYFRRG